jgi:hypothetical protein
MTLFYDTPYIQNASRYATYPTILILLYYLSLMIIHNISHFFPEYSYLSPATIGY